MLAEVCKAMNAIKDLEESANAAVDNNNYDLLARIEEEQIAATVMLEEIKQELLLEQDVNNDPAVLVAREELSHAVANLNDVKDSAVRPKAATLKERSVVVDEQKKKLEAAKFAAFLRLNPKLGDNAEDDVDVDPAVVSARDELRREETSLEQMKKATPRPKSSELAACAALVEEKRAKYTAEKDRVAKLNDNEKTAEICAADVPTTAPKDADAASPETVTVAAPSSSDPTHDLAKARAVVS